MENQEVTSPDSHTVTEIHSLQWAFVRTSPHPEALIYENIHDTGIQMLLQNTHDYFSSCNSEFSVYRDVGMGAQGPARPVFSQSNHIMKGCSETSLSEAFAGTAKSNAEDPRLHDILNCWKDQQARRALD